MTEFQPDLMRLEPYVVAVVFHGSHNQYDYLVTPEIDVAVGDTVEVLTKRGSSKVTVVEVKPSSPKATAYILGKVG